MVSKELSIKQLKTLFENEALSIEEFKKDLESFSKNDFIDYLIENDDKEDNLDDF